ncbi:helix-turn-helix domain-containing protein, partial [Bacteroides heparinolyticus]|uniref:winged helix-turn-helix domain-containing protein n=1 Tax=Prevotella heparinolytica TaxID=28113 RepID=UPI0035A02957
GVLRLLAENKGEVVRREAILSRYWDTEDNFFASRSLDVFISKLRKLFEDDPQIEIKTVRGVGLMLGVGVCVLPHIPPRNRFCKKNSS